MKSIHKRRLYRFYIGKIKNRKWPNGNRYGATMRPFRHFEPGQ
ncbi:MAG: hypothetical protein H6Q38_1673 [Chloroflexi bacterium]|nr:hypothetical protein [Chloroflexota bacterium]